MKKHTLYIILINGKAGSGKSLVSTLLKHQLRAKGYNAIVSPNARTVKEYAKLYFNWDGVKDERGRKLLIDLTNTGYNYDNFFWESMHYTLLLNLSKSHKEGVVAIIDDWRYENTFNYFNVVCDNVLTIRVDGDKTKYSSEVINDKSETGLDNFDFDVRMLNDVKDIRVLDERIEYLVNKRIVSFLEEGK